MTSDYQEIYKQLLEQRLTHFQDIMQIHLSGNFTTQFYEIQFPLTIQECTNDPQNVQNQYTISFHTPGQSFSSVFGAEIFQEPTVPHRQNYCTLTYVSKGNLYKIISGKRTLYPAGSCFLLNRGTYHTENFDTEYQTLNLTIRPDFVVNLCKSSFLFPNEAIGADDLCDFICQEMEPETGPQDYISFSHVLGRESPVEPLLRQMVGIMETGGPGATFQLQHLFCLLFSCLANPAYYHTNYFKLKGDASTITFSRITHLLEDSDGRITREEMEQMLKYDGAYLSRIVKKHAGMSLTDYRMTFRMDAAKAKLKHTDRKITEILQELGCTNRTFFCRMFKERYGMTPLEYRKKYRG